MKTPVTFLWKAHDDAGRAAQGKIQAANAALAQALLRRQGWQEIQLQRLWWNTASRVRTRDVAQMTRQLAALALQLQAHVTHIKVRDLDRRIA